MAFQGRHLYKKEQSKKITHSINIIIKLLEQFNSFSKKKFIYSNDKLAEHVEAYYCSYSLWKKVAHRIVKRRIFLFAIIALFLWES